MTFFVGGPLGEIGSSSFGVLPTELNELHRVEGASKEKQLDWLLEVLLDGESIGEDPGSGVSPTESPLFLGFYLSSDKARLTKDLDLPWA